MAADPAIVQSPVAKPAGAPDDLHETGDRLAHPPTVLADAHRRQWLVQREGSFWGRGRFFELPLTLPEATLGRSLSCHLRVNDESVSRIHAALVRKTHRGVYLMDLASRGGTFLNGERIEGDELLMDGDRIGLGDRVTLEFVDGPRPRGARNRGWIRRFGWAFSGLSLVALAVSAII